MIGPLVKQRIGHECEQTWIVVSIVNWEGIPKEMADNAYEVVANDIANHGKKTL